MLCKPGTRAGCQEPIGRRAGLLKLANDGALPPPLSPAYWRRARRLLRLPNSPADSEDVPVWVPHVHLANMPRHVGGRPGDFKTLLEAALVDGVHIVHPDGHPHALVGSVIPLRTERHLDSALAPATLGVLAQENLACAGADARKRGGTAPVPGFLPAE